MLWDPEMSKTQNEDQTKKQSMIGKSILYLVTRFCAYAISGFQLVFAVASEVWADSQSAACLSLQEK